MDGKKLSELTFEQSMQRLEKITNNLEDGNVPLENAVNLYAEGIKLQEHCKNKLEHAKIRISKITQNKGKIEVDNFSIE